MDSSLWQQTVSADGVFDKLYAEAKYDDTQLHVIQKIVNSVFHNRLPDDYSINRAAKLLEYREQLVKLIDLPQIEQRTPAWYDMRNSMITASDAAQALGCGKFGTQKQFYMKKCGYEEDKFDSSAPPLRWGVMFEPVANDIYCRRNAIKVHEFGLLRHPTVPFFGASPDGITDLGVMVEIKCPFRRKITGEVPLQYYHQIQGQLDVCGLKECDFLECEFEVADEDAEFWSCYNDYKLGERGCVVELTDNVTGATKYVYSGIDIKEVELRDWIKAVTDGASVGGYSVVREHLWTLRKYNVVRVYHSSSFINEKLAALGQVWANVERYRADKSSYNREVSGLTSRMTSSVPTSAPTTSAANTTMGCAFLAME